MTIEEAVIEKLRGLPPEKQRQVLAFVESLRPPATAKRPLKSAEGLWANLGISITQRDIAQARREMWRNFPRDFPADDS